MENISDIPLWTQSDLANELDWSLSYIQELIRDGVIVPTRRTLRGVPMFEPEYVAWLLIGEPRIAKRVSDLGDRLRG